MLQSRYFAAKYFSNRMMGGIPEKETIVVPPPATVTTKQSGGRAYGWGGWQHLLKDLPTRKRNDEEMLALLAMFVVLEDEDA